MFPGPSLSNILYLVICGAQHFGHHAVLYHPADREHLTKAHLFMWHIKNSRGGTRRRRGIHFWINKEISYHYQHGYSPYTELQVIVRSQGQTTGRPSPSYRQVIVVQQKNRCISLSLIQTIGNLEKP